MRPGGCQQTKARWRDASAHGECECHRWRSSSVLSCWLLFCQWQPWLTHNYCHSLEVTAQAVQQGHAEVVRLLLGHPQIKLSMRTLFPQRVTPLHLAMRAAREDLVTLLLAHPRLDLEENLFMRDSAITIARGIQGGERIVAMLEALEKSGKRPSLLPPRSVTTTSAVASVAAADADAARPHPPSIAATSTVKASLDQAAATATSTPWLQKRWLVSHAVVAGIAFAIGWCARSAIKRA